MTDQKLDKPAQIGSTIFREGASWATVIHRAQREYIYRQNYPEPAPETIIDLQKKLGIEP